VIFCRIGDLEHSMLRVLLALLPALVLATGCGGTPPRVRLTTDWPGQAPDFQDASDKWTRASSLRAQYQEVLELAAVLKSPEWRAAHAARDAEHRGLAGAAREQRMAQARAEMEGPWEVALLVTTWDRRENDLDRGKRSVWRVVLVDDAGNEIEPIEIIKDRRPAFTLRADYPALGDFATAYTARFPRDVRVMGPGVDRVRLRMSSPRGAVELVWASR
jgi:hypothetical protein